MWARALLALALVAHSRVGVDDGIEPPALLREIRGASSADMEAPGLRCLRPSSADVEAAVASASSDDAAALLVYGAGPRGVSGAGDALLVASGDDLCFLLVVQQPASIAVHLHRPIDLPGVLPDAWQEDPPHEGSSAASMYPHPPGACPDDVMLRLYASDGPQDVAFGAAEVTGGSSLDGSDTFVLLTPTEGIAGGGNPLSLSTQRLQSMWLTSSVRATSLAAARATWHTPPRFTAYAGVVPPAVLTRLAALAGMMSNATGSVEWPLHVALAVHVEHAAFTWASGPPRTAHACSGGDNGGCGLASSMDDVGVYKQAHLPIYAPVVLPPAHVRVARTPTPMRRLLPPCEAGANLQHGFWAPSVAPGRLSHAVNGLSWYAEGCALKAFDPAATGQCLASVSPSHIAFVGDSHIRRHFKDLIGRGSTALYAWMRATPATGSPLSANAVAVLAADARALASDAASTRSSWCGGGVSGARYGDVDCLCSDIAYGPTESVPNPLEAFYGGVDEVYFHVGGARSTLLWFAGFTEPEAFFDLERAMLVRGDDTTPAGAAVFDLVHWDAAFGTLARFEHSLPAFVEWLHAAFPPPAVLVFRTPTFFAGDDVAAAERYRGRRYMSHGKVAWMRALALRALRAHRGIAPRLLVWDVYGMGASRRLADTLSQQSTCTNGHERAEDIEVQAHVLLNLLCGGARAP